MRRALGVREAPNGRRARAAAVAGAIGLVALTWPTVASAAPFDLVWSAPEGCPSREQIMEATRARLGEVHSDAAPELFVHGTVSAQDSRGFVVRLAMTDSSGHALGDREVHVDQETCREVVAPTSLVLAMMIAVARPPSDGPAREEQHPTTEAPTPAVASPPQGTTPAGTPAPAPQPSAQRLLLGAAGVTSTGILPAAGVGVGARGAYSPAARVVFALEMAFETSRPVRVAGGDIGFQLFSASARVGLNVLRTTIFEVYPTVGARGALLRTTPTGFTAVHNEIRSTMFVGPGVLGRAQLAPHFFVEILPELEAVLVRDRFRIREDAKLYHIHRASPFAGRLSVGIAYEFR